MNIILDTSVLITLLLAKKQSTPKNIVSLAKSKKLVLLISSITLLELKDIVQSERFKRAPTYNPRKISIFIAWYQYNAKKIKVDSSYKSSLLRDPKDNIFLQLALTSKAQYLISNDKDLLVLKSVGNTKIVTPKEFITIEFPKHLKKE